LKQPPNETTTSVEDALVKAAAIGYPVMMRPSFVLGGAKMEIVYDESSLRTYWEELIIYCTKADVQISEECPILIDKFLQNATEVDVDAISDGNDVYVAGIMEHIEEAGIHSGDSACALPPFSLSKEIIAELEESTTKMALELGVKGLMNVQYAIREGEVFVIEVNPRASRTVPFVSKVTGVPVAKMATKVMLGHTLKELGLEARPVLNHTGVKESVFPWTRFPGVDAVLGPEMKSTGEVMGIDRSFPMAFAKSQLGAGTSIPVAGTAFLSVKPEDKAHLEEVARGLSDIGFNLIATSGTAREIRKFQIPVEVIKKVSEGRPNVVDAMIDDRVHLIINTPSGKKPRQDEISIRTNAVQRNVPLVTTMRGAKAFIEAIRKMKENSGPLKVEALQVFHS
ncbi:MAG: ATP-grasp domain-containing protein, partial [Planctomycetes bacterium]|nr:ATP-grasp domain-containing protein [Planctomycetota bacterium]